VPAVDVKRAVETVGGEQEIEHKLRRFAADVHYLQSIRQDLLRKYAERWVAIYEGSLVGNAKTFHELLKQLSEKAVRQNEAVIEYLAKDRKAMLL
jgi:hypothetical protein